MLDQNSTVDFYNLFIRTNELLLETLQQLKRIADYVEMPYVDTEGVIKNIVNEDNEDNECDKQL